jgi:hypothetical protein
MQEPIKSDNNGGVNPIEESALMEAFSKPFQEGEVKFKPQVIKGNKALVLAFVDARTIQDRLDDVLGTSNWQDDYECLPDGSVLCRLRIRVGGEWLTKVDVGGPSEQPDGGDRVKAAFSDALKRAAVKFGIGRYLYRLPQFWCDYDPQTKKILKPPQLPEWALPPRKNKVAPKEPAPIKEKPPSRVKQPAVPKEPIPPREPVVKPIKATSNLPANGEELQRRLYDYDARLARQGLCQPGELVKCVVQAGVKAGFDSDLATWTGDAIHLAVEETKAFEARMRQAKAPQKDVA